jgi:NAD(P)-dependent dehydrogenase (short-subunit alcohol dehydrogenase family)
MNMSSVGGRVAFPALSIYHATKFAVEGMSESLAQEVAPFGIKVTIIEPGAFRTEWTGRSAAFAAEHDAYAGTPAAYVRNQVKSGHGQQPGDPALAAKIVVAMAGRESPPLRLPLGPDAFQQIRARFDADLQSMAALEPSTAATSFVDAGNPVAAQ